MATISILKTTLDQLTTAEQIGQSLVRKKLAACIHIKKIRSIYEWEDELQSDKEYLLSAKCSHSKFAEALKHLESLHPYDLPMIIREEVECNEAYHSWVDSQCK